MFLNARLKSKNPLTRMKALAEVHDDAKLILFAADERDWEVRKVALSQIQDTELIKAIALNPDSLQDGEMTYEYSRRMNEKAAADPAHSEQYYRSVFEFCIEKAKIAPNQGFLSMGSCFTRDQDIADFLIALGRIYQEAKKKTGSSVLIKYPYAGYARLSEELSEKMSDQYQIARVLSDPFAFAKSDKIGDIKDKALLQQIADHAGSEYMRKEAGRRLEHFDRDRAQDEFKQELQGQQDANALLDRMFKEKQDWKIVYIGNRIEQIGDQSLTGVIERKIREISADRSAYPPQLRASLISAFGKLRGMQWKEAQLYFVDEYDLEQYEKDLDNEGDVMGQMRAVKDLQALYRQGRFTDRIGAMFYKGKPVATYKDPYGPQIVV